MHTEMQNALAYIRLQPALDAYFETQGYYPPDQALADGAVLWEHLQPFFGQVIRNRRFVIPWMDLSTNRFLTTPGLRLISVDWRNDPERGEYRKITAERVY